MMRNLVVSENGISPAGVINVLEKSSTLKVSLSQYWEWVADIELRFE